MAWTEQAVLELVAQVWAELGRRPTTGDVTRHPASPALSTVWRPFQGWTWERILDEVEHNHPEVREIPEAVVLHRTRNGERREVLRLADGTERILRPRPRNVPTPPKISDDEVRRLHQLYVRSDLSVPVIAAAIWERYGYASAQSCTRKLYERFKRLGLRSVSLTEAHHRAHRNQRMHRWNDLARRNAMRARGVIPRDEREDACRLSPSPSTSASRSTAA